MKRHTLLKVACALSGTTVTDLAKRWNVAQPTVTQVSQGVKRSRPLEARIDAWCSQVLKNAGIDIGRKAA